MNGNPKWNTPRTTQRHDPKGATKRDNSQTTTTEDEPATHPYKIEPSPDFELENISGLIGEWEINADKFKVQSPGESICRNSPGGK